ncbi:threonine/serine dehydratase [Pseudomonas sp. CJQ_7]|jgi:threonine dehydratase|uniref:Threonine/serine dehydratase n=1 Tax=Pseudomonas monteilii TaxID=76759 RepID=A0A2N1IJV9_9PSED|nr:MULTISPECIES: threonine/serine dehydratase [Pseudomonas]EKT4454647.1 threonine/serine dehydratase [Pseudomonas putida]EKT4492436.1 threonine/serine dehydratase [Pseudomonas putida]EKT4511718.1 threonine/serine dehydratase [Pseudomonas putida]EKT4527923.1 threonine/serine dehydratase [Pseudomonas putida]EKT8863717.1 threonine/serine dehydratase [Pseudomonas putida]
MPVATVSPTVVDARYLDALYTSIREAHGALRPAVSITPLTRSAHLSALTGCEVLLKCEHLQHTGSFKFRGASNKVRLLPAEVRKQGVIAASSGNHGQALALAGKMAGVPVKVYTTTGASAYKIEAMRALGAEVVCLPTDPLSAELEAARQAEAHGVPFVSPYNDLQVIAGQGTIGMELFEQAPDLDAVFVAVGGGGMISGIGAALRVLKPGTEIIGCWPANDPTLQQSLKAGEIIEVDACATLSDGTAGGVEPGSITFPLCQALLTDTVLVSEDEIRCAMREIASSERWIIEGAAAVAVAGMQKLAERYQGKRVAVILCGRNILLEKFLEAVQ